MKKQNGFTLIELMIVIAIIGLLAAIVLGSKDGFSNHALRQFQHSQCLPEDPSCNG